MPAGLFYQPHRDSNLSAANGRENADALAAFQNGCQLCFNPINENKLGLIFGHVQLLEKFTDGRTGFDGEVFSRIRHKFLQGGEQFDSDMCWHNILDLSCIKGFIELRLNA
jgi:hypothetical protein